MAKAKQTKKTAAKAKKPATKPAKKAAAKPGKKPAAKAAKGKPVADVSLFRINIEVGDLDRAAQIYGQLLGQEGRKQAGSRCYFSAGDVTLQVVDVSPETPHVSAKALYFLVRDLDKVHAVASELGVLSNELVHGMNGGLIAVRPWGERSFYADDPWGNPLCFVEAGTVYPG
jgi:hypothetical protein